MSILPAGSAPTRGSMVSPAGCRGQNPGACVPASRPYDGGTFGTIGPFEEDQQMRLSRHRLAGAFAMAVLLALCAGPAHAVVADVNFFLGLKSMDLDVASEVDGVERQAQLGVAVTVGAKDWPIQLAVDLLGSSGDDSFGYSAGYGGYSADVSLKYEVDTTELDLGVRKGWDAWKNGSIYVGGGAAFVRLDARVTLHGSVSTRGVVVPPATLVDDDDDDVGYWLDAGLLWRRDRFNFGVDLRYSYAKAKIEDVFGFSNELDSGGVHFGVILGFNVGRR